MMWINQSFVQVSHLIEWLVHFSTQAVTVCHSDLFKKGSFRPKALIQLQHILLHVLSIEKTDSFVNRKRVFVSKSLLYSSCGCSSNTANVIGEEGLLAVCNAPIEGLICPSILKFIHYRFPMTWEAKVNSHHKINRIIPPPSHIGTWSNQSCQGHCPERLLKSLKGASSILEIDCWYSNTYTPHFSAPSEAPPPNSWTLIAKEIHPPPPCDWLE